MNPVLYLLIAALSANALTTPFAHRAVDHAALAARIAAPEPVPAPVLVPVDAPLKTKIRRTKKCAAAAQSPISKTPVNVEPAPPPASSKTSSKPHSTSTSKTEPSPTPSSSSPPPSGGVNPSDVCTVGGTNQGDATYFAPGLGACGFENTSSDFIVAVAFDFYDKYPGYAGPGTNPNLNPICGKKIRATYQGNSVDVTVVDRCAGCTICGSLDFAPIAFSQLANQALGRLHNMTWEFI